MQSNTVGPLSDYQNSAFLLGAISANGFGEHLKSAMPFEQYVNFLFSSCVWFYMAVSLILQYY